MIKESNIINILKYKRNFLNYVQSNANLFYHKMPFNQIQIVSPLKITFQVNILPSTLNNTKYCPV